MEVELLWNYVAILGYRWHDFMPNELLLREAEGVSSQRGLGDSRPHTCLDLTFFSSSTATSSSSSCTFYSFVLLLLSFLPIPLSLLLSLHIPLQRPSSSFFSQTERSPQNGGAEFAILARRTIEQTVR